MKNVYVLASYGIPVGKHIDKSHRDLVREAYLGTLADAGWKTGEWIESVWSGTAMLHSWEQYCIAGQIMTVPLIADGLLPERIPLTNVEGACATGSLAFQGACMDVLSGLHQVSLAIGFEKMILPHNRELTLSQIGRGFDCMHHEETQGDMAELCRVNGVDPESFGGADHSPAMDVYNLQALYHMKKYGSTQRQLAEVAAKNHNNGVKNPLAQYRFSQTVEQVLEDRPVGYPLTRAMCSPTGDGAAAAIVISEDFYKNLPQELKRRCVRVAGMALSSGKRGTLDEPTLTRIAADRAYEMAGVGPEDIDFVELHDAAASREIIQTEMLRLCPEGQGGILAESGETQIDGKIPVNPSGGLISRGHPIGATGLYMVNELVTQIRGEAGERQVKNAEIGLAENGGGVLGFEEAECSVVIFQKAE